MFETKVNEGTHTNNAESTARGLQKMLNYTETYGNFKPVRFL
jgi:hypothetical protein